MYRQNFDAIIGFSAVPKITKIDPPSGADKKKSPKEFRLDVSGHSADLALALKDLGVPSLVLGTVKKTNRAERECFRRSRQKSDIPFLELSALNKMGSISRNRLPPVI